MKFYFGKWYVAVRFKNDLCVGLGKPSQELVDQADLSRKNRGV